MFKKSQELTQALENRLAYLDRCKAIACEHTAQQFVALFQREIAKHKLNRHRIKIVAGMGTSFITINERILSDCDVFGYCKENGKIPRIMETINQISAIVEENYDIFYHVDGTYINDRF